MLTARGEEADRIVGLELGADDYVTKPFSPRELATRVRTVLRRSNPAADSSAQLSFDGLELDAATREAHLNGEQLRLTAKEFDLLFFLASNPRNVFSRDQLMSRVWGYEAARRHGHRHRAHSPAPRQDRGRPREPAPPRDDLGRRLQVPAVIALALAVAAGTLAVGLAATFALRLLPSVRLQLAGFALLSVVLPLLAVLLSGWVMFHMGDDVKILAVAAASASAAVAAALVLVVIDRAADRPASLRLRRARRRRPRRPRTRGRPARARRARPVVQCDGRQPRRPLRRSARARRGREPRSAGSRGLDRGDARGDRGRSRDARRSTSRPSRIRRGA